MAWPIEIKGGGISFSSRDKEWTSDNGFETFTIKDPFKQAMVAKEKCHERLKK